MTVRPLALLISECTGSNVALGGVNGTGADQGLQAVSRP